LKATYPLLFATLLSLLFIACSVPKPVEYRSFKNFSVQKIGFAASTIKMELVYFNPNNFGLALKNTDIDIFINDVFLGHSTQDYQIFIPKKEEFSMPLSMELDMKNILRNSMNALLSNQVKVKITGSVKVGKANTFISFPVMYEGNQQFSLFQ
jgi:LEA14-like dessication related protein